MEYVVEGRSSGKITTHLVCLLFTNPMSLLPSFLPSFHFLMYRFPCRLCSHKGGLQVLFSFYWDVSGFDAGEVKRGRKEAVVVVVVVVVGGRC